jgi:predicted Zn finger-like uncharacterized protein
VKFACDRCKTRYSIADERVRGKILKIRCKACANVITVREGMEVAAEESERSHRPTTLAPASTVGSGGVAPSQPAPTPTLGAAFASAMAAPQAPPKLEDEWYVSRDGDQQGPFGLANAQAWVSQQPEDAELYCWCEGFDDWLPVDRIAHFRGLRSRPPPPAPPPLPTRSEARAPSGSLPSLRGGSGASAAAPAASAPAAARAAASLYPGAPASTGSRAAHSGSRPGFGGGAPAATEPAPRTTQIGTAPTTAQTGLRPTPALGGPATDDKPLFAASMAALQGEPASARREPASNGHHGGAALSRGAAVAAPAFDVGDLGSQGFAADASASGLRSASGLSSFPSSPADDLEFGEVSRVVRIADIGKPPPRATGAARALSAPEAALSTGRTAQSAALVAPLATADAGRGGGAPTPAAQQRKHTILFALVAFALIGAGVVALVLLQNADREEPSMLSVSGRDVNELTIRPDDPRRGGSGSAARDPGAAPTPPVARPSGGKRPGSGTTVAAGGDPGTGGGKVEATPALGSLTPLGGDEVEEMSQRNSSGLQRCYEQALKKDIFLEVKSIKVTLSIDASGQVKDVSLSSHADHVLGQCMAARIRGWRFRQNSKGLDAKFTVAFGRT